MHPSALISVAVYVVVDVAVQSVLLALGLLRPVAGDHVMEPVPVAEMLVVCPTQILASGPAKTFGIDTVTVTSSVSTSHVF